MLKSLFFLFLINQISLQSGQWFSADLDSYQTSSSFQEVQQYVISQLSSLGLLHSEFHYKSFENVYTQVVAGLNWKFDLIFSHGEEDRTFGLIVWQKLPNEEEKFKFSHVSVSSNNRNNGIELEGGWSGLVDENIDEIRRIYDFARKHLEKTEKETKGLSFLRVEDLETQVVNGKNYKFTFVFEDAIGQTSKFNFKVWVKDSQISVTSMVDSDKSDLPNSLGNLLGGWVELDPQNLGSVDEKCLKLASSSVLERMKLHDFKFLRLEKAMSQVVAGIKYDYVMAFVSEKEAVEKRFQVVVWKKLDGFNTENQSIEILDIKEIK